MITVLEVYDAYPNRDLLPIERPVGLDLDDIEEMSGDIGDTLFIFLCRELCGMHDELNAQEAHGRMHRAILDLRAIMDMLERRDDFPMEVNNGTPEQEQQDDKALGRLDVAERVAKAAQYKH